MSIHTIAFYGEVFSNIVATVGGILGIITWFKTLSTKTTDENSAATATPKRDSRRW